jgi:hypothetical protein
MLNRGCCLSSPPTSTFSFTDFRLKSDMNYRRWYIVILSPALRYGLGLGARVRGAGQLAQNLRTLKVLYTSGGEV